MDGVARVAYVEVAVLVKGHAPAINPHAGKAAPSERVHEGAGSAVVTQNTSGLAAIEVQVPVRSKNKVLRFDEAAAGRCDERRP